MEKCTNETFNFFFFFNTDKTTNFPLKLSVTDIDGQNRTNYRVGEYLKFVLDFESTRNVKAVIQSCEATSDGSRNEYSLVYNRYVFKN